MCTGISLFWRDLPESLIEQYDLHDRVIVRHEGADREIRFLYRERRAVLPVWHNEQMGIYPWGNRERHCRLPRTGWVAWEDIEAGYWSEVQPELVDIPACFGLDRGIWYQIQEGIRGIVVFDPKKQGHVYMLTDPASHYYQVMTRNDRMPILINQRI